MRVLILTLLLCAGVAQAATICFTLSPGDAGIIANAYALNHNFTGLDPRWTPQPTPGTPNPTPQPTITKAEFARWWIMQQALREVAAAQDTTARAAVQPTVDAATSAAANAVATAQAGVLATPTPALQ